MCDISVTFLLYNWRFVPLHLLCLFHLYPPPLFQAKQSLIKIPPHFIKTHLLDIFTQTLLHVACTCFCDYPLLDVHGRPLPPTFWMDLF